MKYQHVVTEVFRKPWAILPDKFNTITQLISLRAAGEKLTEAEIRARLGIRAARQPGGTFGAVAVIPIFGVISHRMNLMTQMSGGTSIEKLTAQFRQALADPSVKAIVFDVDSPGGSVEGVAELADEILKSRGQKKTVAVSNAFCASAAYWLASAAEELVVTASGEVGSIGVFAAHEDVSKAMETAGVKISLISAGKYKTEGNPYEPLSDEARAELQSKVDAFYGMFIKAVAAGRGVTQASVREGFGQGRMVLAADAVKSRMVDRIGTLDQTLARLGAGATPQQRMSAAADPALLGQDDDAECECGCLACQAGNCEMCSDEECADLACADNGCPNQAGARAAAAEAAAAEALAAKSAAALARRQRELDLH